MKETGRPRRKTEISTIGEQRSLGREASNRIAFKFPGMWKKPEMLVKQANQQNTLQIWVNNVLALLFFPSRVNDLNPNSVFSEGLQFLV